jgi:hypothetical protein
MFPESSFSELTSHGLMLLRRLGNGCPSLSQIELVQEVLSLIPINGEGYNRLDELLSNDTQSRESLRRDSLYFRSLL